MNSFLIRIAVGLGLISLIGSLAFFYLIQPPDLNDSPQKKNLEIAAGMSFNEIANKLKAEKFVRSKTVFKIYSLLVGKARQFKAGKYNLNPDLSIPELVRILSNGPVEISATIRPGMTLKEIDKNLSSLGIIKEGELINFNVGLVKDEYSWLNGAKSLEGFLLPDTYYFFAGSDINGVVKKILDNFDLKALPFLKNGNNLIQILILASLLEREIPDYTEQQIAADVLMKRLGAGMPLQLDASLTYAKCLGYLNCPLLSEADYKINSLYNTYIYAGLPPTPICNPNPETIKAVINRKKSDYWYYLSDPETKKTIFSKTFDEHNQNRAKYILEK